MGFEKFEKGSFRGATSVPRISIRSTGSIGVSKAAYEEFFDDEEGVVLYFDEENNLVGLEPADPEENPNAYRMSMNSGSGTVNADSFTKRNGIVPEETTSYGPEWNEEEGLIVLDLDEPLE